MVCAFGLMAGCSTAWLQWEERPQTYVVQPGDTLYSIAFRHQLDFRDLAWWNGVGDDWVISPGQVLALAPPPPGVVYQRQVVAVSRPAEQVRPKPTAAPGRPRPVATPRPRPTPAPVSGATGPTRWRWPVDGPVIAGFDPAAARKGIDIGGRAGAPVHAAAAGKVVYSGTALKGYGPLLIIKHDDEYLSAYAHNQRLLVREGDAVKQGQQISTMGLGPKRKPLLHFEIRRLGKPLDPRKLLPRRPS